MTETFEYAELRNRTQRGAIRFSYSRPEQRWLNRSFIRAVERLSGQQRLERLYREWAVNPPEGENFFAAAMRLSTSRSTLMLRR